MSKSDILTFDMLLCILILAISIIMNRKCLLIMSFSNEVVISVLSFTIGCVAMIIRGIS